MGTDELRERFLDFFKSKGHKVFPSDSLVPDDPTVFFTSAGMNQFKPYFLEERKDIKRAASCQKCLRTDDLKKVGETAYHHTFFEMLGNFSFGDYFKKEAIEFAWEFLTKELKLKGKDLWISVYKDDKEAYKIWRDKIGIPAEKIIKLGEDKNFWPANAPTQGPNGPCGPCAEIFFDQGKNKGCRKKECAPACDCDRFVEVWNLVFTQFNRVGKNKLEPLPQKNIDTGMGLERMACVLQGKESNFEIDILAPVVKFVESVVLKSSRPEKVIRSSVNAIVDHARAVTFAIADGLFPSNEKRGYVVRKIIRRALLKARALGNINPFLYKLPEHFAALMKESYPEVSQKKDNVSKIILAEEERYFSMLKEGEIYVSRIMEGLKKTAKNIIGSEDIFRLYDTYGLDLEYIEEFAGKKGLGVDKKGFKALLRQQQERSRKKGMFDEDIFKKGEFDFKEVSEFVGYDTFTIECKVLKLIEDGEEKDILTANAQGLIILDKTPFYPESGGQLTDKGLIKTDEGEFLVEKVFKAGKAIVHKGKVTKGKIQKRKANALVDKERRKGLARAHTATHLLQAALREVLGEHVSQQGSLVDVDRLRFDFTHFNRLSDSELEKVENLVKKFIKNKDKIEKKTLSLNEAKKQGALAFFKEKYEDCVRMVSVSSYSKELCGGTHLKNTADVGNFVVVSESSIASGIRRIEALVGNKANVPSLLEKRKKKAVAKKTEEETREAAKRAIQQEIAKQKSIFISSDEKKVGGLEVINGVYFLKREYTAVGDISQGEQSYVIRALSDIIKQKLDSVFIFIVSHVSKKDIFICSVTDDLIKKGFSCKKFISDYAEELNLKGGGRENLVQGTILNKRNDFMNRLTECFNKFIKQ